jgi:hypothetical protein
MPRDQHQQNQGSHADKYGKEQKEQSKKGSGQDAHLGKPEPQKGKEKKEEHRHQTGR